MTMINGPCGEYSTNSNGDIFLHERTVRGISRSGTEFTRKIKARKGGVFVDNTGYCVVYLRGKNRRVHILVAEAVLGRALDQLNVVHHIDGDKLNNKTSNLVICENRAYHSLIHARENVINCTRGAHKNKGGKWIAQATINGKNTHLGTFITKEEAYARKLEWLNGDQDSEQGLAEDIKSF